MKRFLPSLLILIFFLGLYVFLSSQNQKQTLGLQINQNPTPTLAIGSIYPNPLLTPGDIFPDSTLEEICQPGYTSKVRDVPVSEKKQVYQEYGLSYPQPKGFYEVDHFIPLELGGSNDIKNLFPEAVVPKPGFHEKDIVENYLHEQVCSGRISLQEAQIEIKTDWYNIYKTIPNPQNYKW